MSVSPRPAADTTASSIGSARRLVDGHTVDVTGSAGRLDVNRVVAAARAAAAADAASAAAAERDGGHVATDHLGRLLAATPTIEQAKGVLMGFYRVDPDTAFAILRRWSSDTNLKLRRVAEELVDVVSRPDADDGVQSFLTWLGPAADPAQVMTRTERRT